MALVSVSHSSLLIALAALFAGVSCHASGDHTVTNAYPPKLEIATGEWPPFADSKREDLGIGLSIITEAFKKEGISVHFTFASWHHTYRKSKKGRYEASGIWFKTQERESDFLFSDPILPHNNVFFHLKNRAVSWNQLTDLSGKIIGATTGYAYGGGFESTEKSRGISVNRTTSDIKNLERLMGNKIDLFPSDIDVGYYLIKQHFSPADALKVTHSKKVISRSPTHLIVPKALPKKRAQAIIESFNAGLKKLQISGEYTKIVSQIRRLRN